MFAYSGLAATIGKGDFRAYSKEIVCYLFILCYAGLFVLARYPFYQYLPIPLPIVADGTEYYQVYKDMLNGAPHFDIITAGYPLFICFVHEFFSEKAIALYFAQSAAAFSSGLLLLFYVYRYYRMCVPLVSVALILFLTQDATLRFETASFPQSLMVSAAFAFLSFLIGVLNRPGHVNMFLLCLSAFFLVLLKSSQLYILPVVALVISYCLFIRRKKIACWIFVYITSLLFVYAGYNYFTIQEFSILAPGILKPETQQKSSGIKEMKTQPKVITPSEQALFYKIGAQLPKWHPIYKIQNSSNLDTLQQAYLTARWGSMLKKDSARNVMNLHVVFELKKTVNIDSIVLNNKLFSEEERKLFAAVRDSVEGMLINFYPRDFRMQRIYFMNLLLNIKRNFPIFYLSELSWRYDNFFISRPWVNKYDLNDNTVKERLSFLLREFFEPPKGSKEQYQIQYQKMTSDLLFKAYDLFQLKIGRPLTRNIFWLYVYLFLGSTAIFKWLLNLRNGDYFFLTLLTLMHLGSCLIHAHWADPLNRYSYATEFVPFLLLAFSPLLFKAYIKVY